jgi:hypothetical protein
MIVMVIGLVGFPALAELAPSAYLSLQKKAPEKVTIKVDQVKRQGIFRREEWVKATVTAVSKSESKLKVGDKIEIRYRNETRNIVGPSPIPQLDKGQTYPAWLKKNGEGHYGPSARGKSFQKMGK